ncbi:MAG: Trk system potassium transporter TrkA, partial [Clostridia bacterium]|nr:Trk system potassium transporter TrkA [Clostridia bacterium]
MKTIVKNKPGSLQIIVVGCGKVGHTLVEQLTREGHDLTVVDTQAQVISEITDEFDVLGIQGNGGSLRVLEEAGLQKADVMIAVTGSDELNLLCCTLSRKAGNDIAAIARVRNPDYSEELPYLRRQLGLAMIVNPEMEAAKEIARLISRPQALTVNAFAKGHAELVRFRIPKDNILGGKRIMDLESIFGFGYLICTVERGDEVVIPRGPFVLQEGDEITVLSKARDVHRVFESIGMRGSTVRSCMVVGGGRASYYLARLLLDQHMDVKIIEKNRERCRELTALLPRALVVCGDGSNEAMLLEEGIETAESFAALTGIDEENILMSLY